MFQQDPGQVDCSPDRKKYSGKFIVHRFKQIIKKIQLMFQAEKKLMKIKK